MFDLLVASHKLEIQNNLFFFQEPQLFHDWSFFIHKFIPCHVHFFVTPKHRNRNHLFLSFNRSVSHSSLNIAMSVTKLNLFSKSNEVLGSSARTVSVNFDVCAFVHGFNCLHRTIFILVCLFTLPFDIFLRFVCDLHQLKQRVLTTFKCAPFWMILRMLICENCFQQAVTSTDNRLTTDRSKHECQQLSSCHSFG